jgi:hypothetical protein
MSPRVGRRWIALSGILGTALLGTYFGVGFSIPQLAPDATTAQVASVATQYHTLWLLGAWIQATGSLLSVLFFVGLVSLAGAATRLAGMLTLLGSAVLLAVVLVEGVFTIDLAQATANGHLETALTSYDLMTVFVHIYPIVPAPLIFLALGTVLLKSRVLPRPFGYLALSLGGAYVLVGLVSLVALPLLALVVLSLQAVWVAAAAITLLVRSGGEPGDPAGTRRDAGQDPAPVVS